MVRLTGRAELTYLRNPCCSAEVLRELKEESKVGGYICLLLMQ
jgi:hypothetical protein